MVQQALVVSEILRVGDILQDSTLRREKPLKEVMEGPVEANVKKWN